MTTTRRARTGGDRPSSAAYIVAVAVALLAWLVPGPAVPPAAANEVISAGSTVQVEVSKGRAIRLDRPAAMVFVADPEVADYQIETPNVLYVFGRRVGETTLFAVDADDQVILNVNLEVNHNLSRLRRALNDAIPGNTIELRSVDGAVVLSGTVASADDSEDARRLAATFVKEETNVINQLSVSAPSQVNLRVRVIESSRDDLRRLGINWDAIADVGNFVLGFSTGIPTTTAGLPFFPTDRLATGANSLVTRPGGRNSAVGNFNNGTVDLTGLIDALETEGLVRTLAEPNLTALSGETASFLAGGEFPIIVPQEDGVFSVSFKQFGVSLTFTPTIIGTDRISLDVRPEVSQLSNAGSVSFQGFTIPALTTRRAQTTVELNSGQSFAIAGLLQTSINDTVDKVPWLGDVPVLGQLFRSEEFQRNETELVIVVTPMLVKPVDRPSAPAASPTPPMTGNIPPPADGPSGQGAPSVMSSTPPPPTVQNNSAPPAGATGGPTLIGPAGFIVE